MPLSLPRVVAARGVPIYSTIAADDSGIFFGFAQDGLSRAPDTRAGMTKTGACD
jgi:hypothetical protein